MATEISASPTGGASTQLGRRSSFNAAELAGAEFQPVRWVIPDLLPEGLAVLAGNPKVGKSWLALDLAIAIADTGSVLYLALEDNARRLQSRLMLLLGDRVPPEGLDFRLEWPSLDAGGMDAIEKWLGAHRDDARAVVIDTLARIRPGRRSGEDIYLGDNQVWGKLQQFTSRYNGLLVLGLHHLRKGHDDDPVKMISGSQGVAGSMDTVMVLTKARGTDDGSLYVVGRDVSETSREMRLQRDGVWTDLGPTIAVRINQERKDILDALQTGPKSPAELAALTGSSAHAVRQRLYRAQEVGLVKQVGRSWTLGETSEMRETAETSRRLAERVLARPEWTWDDYWASVEAEVES